MIEILLDNAVQHTSDGGKITLDLQQLDRNVILIVSDTGEGIAAEHLGKIFDRFYQVDSARSKGKAGLGLSIAKCIIEKHGGRIKVSSRPGYGTTFTIELPLTREMMSATIFSSWGWRTISHEFRRNTFSTR